MWESGVYVENNGLSGTAAQLFSPRRFANFGCEFAGDPRHQRQIDERVEDGFEAAGAWNPDRWLCPPPRASFPLSGCGGRNLRLPRELVETFRAMVSRARGVVVSHPLGMQEAVGSTPSVSAIGRAFPTWLAKGV